MCGWVLVLVVTVAVAVAFSVWLLGIWVIGYGVWDGWHEARICFSDLICDSRVKWIY